MWFLEYPSHAKMPMPRMIHPITSYFRSLDFFFFVEVCKKRTKKMQTMDDYDYYL